MSHESVKKRIIDTHNQIMAEARRLYPGYANAPEPSVYFFETGRAAGLAQGHRRVGYNIHVFAQDVERFVNTTIAHEIAHIVCSYCRCDNGHGKNWKRICHALGGDGQRCFDGGGIEQKMMRHRKRYEYKVDSGAVCVVSDVVHNRIQSGKVYTLRQERPPLNRVTGSHFTGRVI